MFSPGKLTEKDKKARFRTVFNVHYTVESVGNCYCYSLLLSLALSQQCVSDNPPVTAFILSSTVVGGRGARVATQGSTVNSSGPAATPRKRGDHLTEGVLLLTKNN